MTHTLEYLTHEMEGWPPPKTRSVGFQVYKISILYIYIYIDIYSSDEAYPTLRIILPLPPHHHQLFHHRPPTYASYSPDVLPN